MIAVIGSLAFKKLGAKINRPLLDMDIVGTYDDVVAFAKEQGKILAAYPINKGKKYVFKTSAFIVEAEIAWEGSTAEKLLDLIKLDPETVMEDGNMWVSLDVLYLLKMSHRYLKNSPHFLKTMHDIHLMRKMGATIRECHMDFFKLREKQTYDYGHPKLDVTKQSFFNGDGVQYYFDHDSIHEAVARLEKPAYKFYQPETNQVLTSKNLFNDCDKLVQLYGVVEEATVLALERSQIPTTMRNQKVPPAKWSFDFALMKVCTSITSGWFREFAWEHYDQVQTLYDDKYAENFWTKVDQGLVKRYEDDSGSI